MYCGYHHRQCRGPLYATRCKACGAGPYYFPWPNVGFFCQQHKHIPQQMAHGPVGHPGPQGYDDTQDCCCTIQ
ncbi:hypothetical protein D9Q98_007852 [Chlorella vulgaris]|uniref:Uncharacterized protein n=1 Tax=Chlorella vulgaris TaxID=3077 RepID=A0A9D4YTS6_CHLVU|nr:hypothetical protein D9Q98_007852 [Chlorella vulgaris]